MDWQDDEYETLLRRFQPRKPALPVRLGNTGKRHHEVWWIGVAAAMAVLVLAAVLVPRVRKDSGQGQSPPATDALAKPAIEGFDVVSVKVTPREKAGPAEPSITLFPPGGSFRKTNTTLRMLVQLAYGLQDYQVLRGPNWVNSDRYDVEAKSAGDANRAEVLLRIQAMLAERFRLKIHRESQEGPVYELIVAKSGLKVQPTEDSSSADVRIGRYSGKRSMAQLAQYLGGIAGRPVIDKTSLAGAFDIRLEFTPEFVPIGPNGPLADPNGPSVFTAVEDQLGLRLVSAKGTVETLFIDDAQKPSPN
jgi:bla regulator protein blaR1